MKTLLQVAQKLGDLTSKKAPVKTGNLKRKLKEANTGRNVLSGRNSAQAEKQIVNDLKTGTFTFEFNIDVAPDGAAYGSYWNTTDLGPPAAHLKNKPQVEFAQKAYDSAEFQNELDAYIETLTDKIADSISKAIDKELK